MAVENRERKDHLIALSTRLIIMANQVEQGKAENKDLIYWLRMTAEQLAGMITREHDPLKKVKEEEHGYQREGSEGHCGIHR